MVVIPVKCPKCSTENLFEDCADPFVCIRCGETLRTGKGSGQRRALISKMTAAAASGGYTGTCAFADELLADDPSDPDPIYFKGLAAMRAGNGATAYGEWRVFTSRATAREILDRYDSMLYETVDGTVRKVGENDWGDQMRKPMLALSDVIASKCPGMDYCRDYVSMMIKRFPLTGEGAKDTYFATEVFKTALLLFPRMYLTDVADLARECMEYNIGLFSKYRKGKEVPKGHAYEVNLVDGYAWFFERIAGISEGILKKVKPAQRNACKAAYLASDERTKEENARNLDEACGHFHAVFGADKAWKAHEKLAVDAMGRFLDGLQDLATSG